jgi:hypothetical protein
MLFFAKRLDAALGFSEIPHGRDNPIVHQKDLAGAGPLAGVHRSSRAVGTVWG